MQTQVDSETDRLKQAGGNGVASDAHLMATRKKPERLLPFHITALTEESP